MLIISWIIVTIFFLCLFPIGICVLENDKRKASFKRDKQGEEEFDMWPRKYWLERIEDLGNRQTLAFCLIFYIVLTIAAFPGEIYQAILNLIQTI